MAWHNQAESSLKAKNIEVAAGQSEHQ